MLSDEDEKTAEEDDDFLTTEEIPSPEERYDSDPKRIGASSEVQEEEAIVTDDRRAANVNGGMGGSEDSDEVKRNAASTKVQALARKRQAKARVNQIRRGAMGKLFKAVKEGKSASGPATAVEPAADLETFAAVESLSATGMCLELSGEPPFSLSGDTTKYSVRLAPRAADPLPPQQLWRLTESGYLECGALVAAEPTQPPQQLVLAIALVGEPSKAGQVLPNQVNKCGLRAEPWLRKHPQQKWTLSRKGELRSQADPTLALTVKSEAHKGTAASGAAAAGGGGGGAGTKAGGHKALWVVAATGAKAQCWKVTTSSSSFSSSTNQQQATRPTLRASITGSGGKGEASDTRGRATAAPSSKASNEPPRSSRSTSAQRRSSSSSSSSPSSSRGVSRTTTTSSSNGSSGVGGGSGPKQRPAPASPSVAAKASPVSSRRALFAAVGASNPLHSFRSSASRSRPSSSSSPSISRPSSQSRPRTYSLERYTPPPKPGVEKKLKDVPPYPKLDKSLVKKHPWVTCPGRHELVLFKTMSNGFACSRCSVLYENFTFLRSCRECNYDLCKSCLSAVGAWVGLSGETYPIGYFKTPEYNEKSSLHGEEPGTRAVKAKTALQRRSFEGMEMLSGYALNVHERMQERAALAAAAATLKEEEGESDGNGGAKGEDDEKEDEGDESSPRSPSKWRDRARAAFSSAKAMVSSPTDTSSPPAITTTKDGDEEGWR